MFTVEGYIEGVPYTAVVGGTLAESQAFPDEDSRWAGILAGSPNVVALLHALPDDEPVQATPTSEPVPLDLADGSSILTALFEHTEVIRARGDVPAVNDGSGQETPADAVY